VIEAIVEDLGVKRELFKQLEAIVAPTATLATNTSSLSVTSIAAVMTHPQRMAGFHFFNPVPLMKVVEVIAGFKTDAAVCQRLADYARQMGHSAVQANDTPGFIVNHAGRGYGTEALRIAGEGVADFATIDRILKDQAGFRLGPFELLDLTVAGARQARLSGDVLEEVKFHERLALAEGAAWRNLREFNAPCGKLRGPVRKEVPAQGKRDAVSARFPDP
jgi:3-hydroxyacyl-CoA dehydrogenase